MTLAQKVRSVLKDVFGFEHFRQNQGQIVKNIIEGKDVCAVMPTGAGKSLCYQFPSKILDGTVVVISPLISLMKDQVDSARDIGISASFLNSSLESGEASGIYRELMNGSLDLLYIAPERFALEGFAERLSNAPISLFAIDEAHCISEWGHEFRPDYLSVSKIMKIFPSVPVATFTATATNRTQQDIIDKTGLRSPFIVRASFDRPNLFYEVKDKINFDRQLMEFINSRPGESGIIYRSKRDSVDETAQLLQRNGIKALPYHAGMENDVRRKHHDMFRKDEVDIVVATVAFGMGIDKPNIRFIVHGDMPKTLESYYQETGRSGRDGEPAHCLFFLDRGEVPRLRFLIEQTTDENMRRIGQEKLNSVVAFATMDECRRRQLLNYFDEAYPEDNCGMCDVCTISREKVDVTEDAKLLFDAVMKTGQKYGAMYIVELLTGAETARVLKNGHDALEIHGKGKHLDKNQWRSLIEELIGRGYLLRDPEYQVIKICDSGRKIIKDDEPFWILRAGEEKVKRAVPVKKKSRPVPKPDEPDEPDEPVEYDTRLFDRLRKLRMKLAEEAGKPAYVIFSNKSLEDMAEKRPVNGIDLLGVHGVGTQKLRKYGDVFIEEIRAYMEEQ